jgi:glycolate oxidase FAD binding subunit
MTTSAPAAVSRLEGVIGASAVINAPDELVKYAICSRVPAVVLALNSAEEVVEIVKFAASERLAIVPCGARTKLSIGLPPQRYDIALDLTGLNRVVACDPGDLTLSVEPGVLLSTLEKTLAEHGQFLPLSAPFANRATIGGTIASGVDGPLRQFYGTARDFVLGMEFITGEGVAGKSGGRVVKNVTGYDLHKLMIGSLGTLGILTKINFRTFPAPQSVRGFVAHFSAAEDAAACRDKMAASVLRPLTFEIVSPGAAELFESETVAEIERHPLPPGLFSRSAWTVSAGFAGNAAVLDRCERDFRAIAESAGATNFATRSSDQGTDLAPAFARKREFISIALQSSPACTIMKISLIPEHLEHALAAVKHAATDHSLPWAAIARGVGVIYAALLPKSQDEHSLGCVTAATNRIHADAVHLGGHATIPWCPTEWKNVLNIWGPDRPDLALMKKLKSVFDPHGILAPGRFIGGI